MRGGMNRTLARPRLMKSAAGRMPRLHFLPVFLPLAIRCYLPKYIAVATRRRLKNRLAQARSGLLTPQSIATLPPAPIRAAFAAGSRIGLFAAVAGSNPAVVFRAGVDFVSQYISILWIKVPAGRGKVGFRL